MNTDTERQAYLPPSRKHAALAALCLGGLILNVN